MLNKVLRISFISLVSLLFTGLLTGQPGRYREENRAMRFELLDKNNDNRIDSREWQMHFREIDTNKDGTLSRDEMDRHHDMMMDRMDNRRPYRRGR